MAKKTKKTNEENNETLNCYYLTEKQKEVAKKVFRRIDSIVFAADTGYIKLSSAAAYLEKTVRWLRQIDSAPDDAVFPILISHLDEHDAGEKNAAE